MFLFSHFNCVLWLNDAYKITESSYRWYSKSERHYIFISVAYISINAEKLRPSLPVQQFYEYFFNRWTDALKWNADQRRRASHLRGPLTKTNMLLLISTRRNRCLQRRYPYPVKWTFSTKNKNFNRRLSHVVWGTNIWRYWIHIFIAKHLTYLPIFNPSVVTITLLWTTLLSSIPLLVK